MALILSLETSTKVCSVALHQDSHLLAVFELFTEKSHANALTLLIDNLISYCGVKFTDISAIAVSKGPGSYTGLRIGVASAKGLCFALDIPLISVPTLQAMAYGLSKQFPLTSHLFCPMIDARRMEVYCQVFDHQLNTILPVDARIIDAHSFSNILSEKPVIFFGDGAAKCKDILNHPDLALFVDNCYPSAKFIGELALEKLVSNSFENIAYFEPFYLKEFFYKKA